MKVVLLGDTHFLPSNSSPTHAAYFTKFYKFFFDYLKKSDIKTIVQLGDLFDVRKSVNFITIDWANENFFAPIINQNIDLIVLAGNHDILYRNASHINSVSLLCPEGTTVVDLVPQTILLGSKAFDLYPWINDSNIKESLEFAKNSKSDYAIGHFEFKSFPMHPGTIAETGMSHSLFANYEQVFSGHFHTVSQQDNVLYTGTPTEITWSDCNDPKGFWVLDTETGIKEHIRNPYTLFEKISYVEGMSYDFTQVKEKYVKIVVIDKKDQKKFDKFLYNVNHNQSHDVKVIESSIVAAVADAVQLTNLVSTQSMISSVVDTLDVQVDKTKLKHRVLELYTEAEQLAKTL